MIIDDKLNLVMPLYRSASDGVEVIYAYVHSVPVSREVFEASFLLISKTFAAIHGEGLGEIAGPRIASLLLKEVGKNMGGAGQAFMNEVRRLSAVVTRNGSGAWGSMPLQDAIDQKTLDEEDIFEVENAITFFIVESAMHRRKMLRLTMPGAATLWGAQISSLDCMAFVASLRTSTVTAVSAPTQSSLPS